MKYKVKSSALLASKSDFNTLICSVFKTPAGDQLLDHLKLRLMNPVAPPHATEAQARHTEGEHGFIREIIYICQLGEKDA